MATPILMPKMSYDMQEGTVVRWLRDEGEPVGRGEVLAEIETDKATVEMPAYVAGVLGKIVVETGRTVPVGELIAVITDPGEEVPALDSLSRTGGSTASATPVQATAETQAPAPAPAPGTLQSSSDVRASPIARRLARERGIDLARITGTGPGSRIVEADVLAYTETAAAPALTAAAEKVPLTRMRQAIARVTTQSMREAPHFYVNVEIDMTAAIAMRRQVNEGLEQEERVSLNDILIKACAKSLEKYPKFNASFRDDHLEYHPALNIGIAIALEEGLIVVSIPGCQSKTLVEISRASRDLIRRAEGGTLHADEYETTFSISNLGTFDVDSFTAIIYPPNASVLAVGAVKERPVVQDGQIVPAQTMQATLSIDHRIADGAEGARFLAEVKRLLEHPIRLLL